MNYQKAYDALIAYRKSNIPTGYTEKHHILPKSLGGSNDKQNIVKLTAKEHFIAHRLLAKIHGGKMWSALLMMCRGKTTSGKGLKVNARTYDLARQKDAEWRSDFYKGPNNPFFGKTFSVAAIEKLKGPRESVTGSKNPNYGKGGDDANAVISFVLRYRPRVDSVDFTLMKFINDQTGIMKTCLKTGSSKRIKSPELRQLKHYFVCKEMESKPKYGASNPNYGNGQAIAGEKNPMFGKKHNPDTLIKMQERAKNRRKVKCPHCDKIGTVGNMNRWHFDNCKVVSERI